MTPAFRYAKSQLNPTTKKLIAFKNKVNTTLHSKLCEQDSTANEVFHECALSQVKTILHAHLTYRIRTFLSV